MDNRFRPPRSPSPDESGDVDREVRTRSLMPPICRGGEPGDAFQDWLEAEREVDDTGKTFPADRASQSANLRPMPRSSQPKPNAPDTAGGSRALILVDMSCQVLPDAERLLPAARRIAAPIAALKARCRK